MAQSSTTPAEALAAVREYFLHLDADRAAFRDWCAGTVDGGPNSNGSYPLTDYTGDVHLVPCPAAIMANVSSDVIAGLMDVPVSTAMQHALDTKASTADLGSSAEGKGAHLLGLKAPGTGAIDRTTADVLRADVRAADYGSIQQAADFAASEVVIGPPVSPGQADTSQTRLARVCLGPEIYPITSPLVHYSGQTWEGHGSAETANRLNTKITPAQDTDGVRVSPQVYLGNAFHNGLFTNFTIMGPGAGTSPNYYAALSGPGGPAGPGGAGKPPGFNFTSDATGVMESYSVISVDPYYQVVNRGWFPYGWGINWKAGAGGPYFANIAAGIAGTAVNGYFTTDEGAPGNPSLYLRTASDPYYQLIEVMAQGQSSVRRVTVRGMFAGGFRLPKGGLQIVYEDCTSLTNGGIGFYLKTPFNTSQQSIVYSRCSADSSTGGAGLWLDTPNVGGHVSIRDFKSEANINKEFGRKVSFTASCAGTALTATGNPAIREGSIVYAADGTFIGNVTSGSGNAWAVNPGGTFAGQTMTAYYQLDQLNAIRIESAAAGATVSVDGLTHISSGTYFPGGANTQMPLSAVAISGANTPDFIWNNVQVRVLTAQVDYAFGGYTGGATAAVSGGAVTALTNPTVPGLWPSGTAISVNIVGGGGTGATATAAVTNGRVVLTLTNGGSGYTSAPSVILRGPPGIFSDLTYGPRLDRRFTSGRYSDTWRADISRSSTVRYLYGTACDYMAPASPEGPAIQLAGATPGFSLYANSAATDQRKVIIVNSSGALSVRTVTDAGVATSALTVNNTSGVSGTVEINAVLRPSTDNNRTLGSSSFRWKEVFSGTSPINTSDEHTKEWLGPPDEAFKRAMRRIKDEIGLYRFIGGGRTHTGVRAQHALAIAIEEGIELEPAAGWRDPITDPIEEGAEFTLEEWAQLDPFVLPDRPSFRHAMFCVDIWDRQWQDIEAQHDPISERPADWPDDREWVLPEDGPAIIGKRLIRPGGRLYSLRGEEMLFAMMAALEA